MKNFFAKFVQILPLIEPNLLDCYLKNRYNVCTIKSSWIMLIFSDKFFVKIVANTIFV